ncbi:TPA: hypothetical protein ACIUMA_001723 [Salmonella enterica subsp. enterica serovar Reading]|nr:hypothetical protein [Salmonella enterica subsp. enterica serovar Reading]
MTTITNKKQYPSEQYLNELITNMEFAAMAPVEVVRVMAAELQERRNADNQEPAGYHVIKECGKVGCSVATLEEAEKTRDFWNKKWTIRPYFYSAAPAPVVPEEMPKGLADQIVSLLAHNIGDKFLAQKIWNACRAAMLQANQRDLSQPVDPQVADYEKTMLQAGWVMVPVEPTDEMIAAALECEGVIFDSKDPTAFCVQYREIYCAMVDAALALNKGEY